MNRHLQCLVLLSSLAAVGCGGSHSQPLVPGEVLGQVSLSEGVPAADCLVIVEGTPSSAKCDANGQFDIKNVPPGTWSLRILPDQAMSTVPAFVQLAGVNAGMSTTLSPVTLARAGAITGQVIAPSGQDLSQAILAVPDLGSVTAPNPGGGYVLIGVAPGMYDVALLLSNGTLVKPSVPVMPGQPTRNVNFDLSLPEKTSGVKLTGVAKRESGNHAGLTVDLVDDVNGTTAASTTTADDGSFTLVGGPGTYLVRAHEPDPKTNPIRATIPWVFLDGTHDVDLCASNPAGGCNALVVRSMGGDLDGNGIPDATDPDIDGDGVPNGQDWDPFDPAESADTDGDGVGDRADLRSNGGPGIDNQWPLSILNSCPGYDPTAPSACTCQQTSDCPTGVCHSGTCGPCTVGSNECGSGSTCVAGACTKSCASDADCPGGYCVNGACAACKTSNDCDSGQYCDSQNGICRAPCTSNGDCNVGTDNSCDMATHTCVVACTGTCPSMNEVCQSNICVNQCNASMPCPSGFRCDASSHTCQPQCATNADCAGQPHTICFAGQCVNDGTCALDSDCGISKWCNGGVCQDRPNYVAGKGYACNGPCDCKQGEVCQSGFCQGDTVALPDGTQHALAPTLYVKSGASGNGKSPATPSADLAAAVAAMKANDAIALVGGDAITLPAGITLSQSGAAIIGGYQSCQPNRWVRDPSQRTAITLGAVSPLPNSIYTLVEASGNGSAPLDHAAIVGLQITPSGCPNGGSYDVIHSSYSTSLAIADTSFTGTAACSGGGSAAGVVCDGGGCASVHLSNVALLGGQSSPPPITLASFSGSSGTISNSSIPANSTTAASGISIQTPSGEITVDHVTMTNNGNKMTSPFTANCNLAAFPLNVTNNDFAVSNSVNPVVTLTSCPMLNVAGNTVGDQTSTTSVMSPWLAMSVNACSGTISKNQLYFPSGIANGPAVSALKVVGGAGLVIADNSGSGLGGCSLLASIANTSGLTTFTRNRFILTGDINASSGAGLSISNVPAFVVTDSVIQMPKHCVAPALSVSGQSVGLVERSRFLAGAGVGVDLNSSSLELYDSYLYAGTLDQVNNTGNGALMLETGGTPNSLWAVGNTLDGGGDPSGGSSAGIYCVSGFGSLLFTSNLISGGTSANAAMILDTGNSCSGATYSHNYFWYSGQRLSSASPDPAVKLDGVNANIVGGYQYAPTIVQSDGYDLAANSPVIDKGVTGNRQGNPAFGPAGAGAITLDIDGNPRTLGAAPDIGCSEKQ